MEAKTVRQSYPVLPSTVGGVFFRSGHHISAVRC